MADRYRLSAPLRVQRRRIVLAGVLALTALGVLIFYPHLFFFLQIVFLSCLYWLLPLRWPTLVEHGEGSLFVTKKGWTTEIPLEIVVQFTERPIYVGLKMQRRSRFTGKTSPHPDGL